MRRPWQVYFTFLLCVSIAVAAMAWVSMTVLRLETGQRQLEQQAALEENTRLALWRMDSVLGGVIERERARPAYAYEAFHPAQRAYNRLLGEIRAGEVLVPSPLLTERTAYVRLHFQINPGGRISSPEVPEGNMRDLAESQYVVQEEIVGCSQRLEALRPSLSGHALWSRLPDPIGPVQAAGPLLLAAAAPPAQAEAPVPPQAAGPQGTLLASSPPAQQRHGQVARPDGQGAEPESQGQERQNQPAPRPSGEAGTAQQSAGPPRPQQEQQASHSPQGEQADTRQAMARSLLPSLANQAWNDNQQEERQQDQPQQILDLGQQKQRQSSQISKRKSVTEYGMRLESLNSNWSQSLPQLAPQKVMSAPVEGALSGQWLGEELVLIRKVRGENGTFLQGCWLDWPALRKDLTASVQDLLPGADLVPVRNPNLDEGGRILASLPLRLQPGTVATLSPAGLTPLRFSLLVAWVGALAAALALAGLLWGVVSLSERRAAFVSSVTHELRTPLTTFQLYTDLLCRGAITDEQVKAEYYRTLSQEAGRLCRLVENVLAYARLERGGMQMRIEALVPGDFLERIRTRLEERARQANMRIAIQVGSSVGQRRVLAYSGALEQILFNLIDNACKYADAARDRTLDIEVGEEGRKLSFKVSDHGPGISAGQQTKLFRPFEKSAQEAANTAPGVGLGLALCRQLARYMGGDLRLDRRQDQGASFILTLPSA